jgi:hypothetical protein
MAANRSPGELRELLDLLGCRLHRDDLVIVTNHGRGRMTVEARIAGKVALVEVPRRKSFIAWPAGRDFLDQETELSGPLAEEPRQEARPAAAGEGPKVVRLVPRGPVAGEQA